MTARPTPSPLRVRESFVDQLDARLSPRDWDVIQTVNRLRVVSGRQLDRTIFAELGSERSRTVTRSRVLARLVRDRVLVPVGRRIGGGGRGSTTAAFALDTAGVQLLTRRQLATGEQVRVRRPGPPSERTLRHALAVSELYADLVEQARLDGFTVATFKTEPGAWWPNSLGGWLKPDAYAVLERDGVRDHWWCEVDLATESLPTIRTKLQAYERFQQRGARGPAGVLPWLLITTTSPGRRNAIVRLVRQLPEAAQFVHVAASAEAAQLMYSILRE